MLVVAGSAGIVLRSVQEEREEEWRRNALLLQEAVPAFYQT